MKKLIFIILIIFTFTSCAFAYTDEASKTNLTYTHFTYSDMTARPGEYAASKLVELDILKGEKIGTDYYFYPDSHVTRATAISCINRANKYNTKAPTSVTTVFADAGSFSVALQKDAYYACSMGILNGIEENDKYYLKLSDTVTKAEFLCMLERSLSPANYELSNLSYADSSEIPDYALKSVKNLVSKNILKADAGELLNPNATLTKEEMATLLYRFIVYNEKSMVKTMAQQIKENIYADKNV